MSGIGLLSASVTYDWIEPIYSRTQRGVDRLRELNTKGWHNMDEFEREEWANSIHAINEIDLQRIENDVGYLSEVLHLSLNVYSTIPYVVNEDYVSNLVENLQELRDVGLIYPTTPEVPQEPFKDFSTMNAVEKILSDIYEKINSHVSYESIDELHCGEGIGLVL